MVYGRVCALTVSHGYLVYLVVKVWEFGVDAEHRLQGVLLDGSWFRPSVWLFVSFERSLKVFERALPKKGWRREPLILHTYKMAPQ